MTRFKNVFALVLVLILVLVVLRFARNGESAEERLVKKACNVVKDDKGDWSFGNFSALYPDYTEGTVDGKSGEVYPQVLDFFYEQSAAASGAAQINPIWRTLADWKSDYAYTQLLKYLFAKQGQGTSETSAEAVRLGIKAQLRISSECRAFVNRLNS